VIISRLAVSGWAEDLHVSPQEAELGVMSALKRLEAISLWMQRTAAEVVMKSKFYLSAVSRPMLEFSKFPSLQRRKKRGSVCGMKNGISSAAGR
jgi:hypothetical protein